MLNSHLSLIPNSTQQWQNLGFCWKLCERLQLSTKWTCLEEIDKIDNIEKFDEIVKIDSVVK